MIGDNSAGAFEQVAGTGVITQPSPLTHDVSVFGCCEVGHRWPARDESLEILGDGGNSSLLQHDFGHPYCIRIGAHACFLVRWTDSPRHAAGVKIIPI